MLIPSPGYLYNLADDPGETHNLAGSHPEKLKAMQTRLTDILEQK